ERPDLVIVVGDVNSTLACALVAAKRHVPLAHVEAGLRSFDRRMPEELNRVLTDRVADYLFVTEESGVRNLRAEGILEERIFMVGNVMIDSLVRFREKAAALDPLGSLGLDPGSYVLVTMHRPSNVDTREALLRWLPAMEAVAKARPVVFPCHVRTRDRLRVFGLEARLVALPSFRLLDPLGYLEFLRLMEKAEIVVTDSGGIQEETTFLGVPCLTLRETTERPVTVELGTNRLVALEPRGDRPRQRLDPGRRPPCGQEAAAVGRAGGGADRRGAGGGGPGRTSGELVTRRASRAPARVRFV
ncbi:MAG TPA: UDP-N-acetylglucosamine 2-epimerase (non-hydrolyzing), partial [Longimicrobiales bacterium]|nr:UDP-N-acetylglucosamine 2-epimerase (non-hydrolyzing) [Longimicrobiales bacterium]